MTTKQESMLGLVPFAPESSPPGLPNLAPSANRALTKEQERVLDEFHKEMLVIEATAVKTMFGMSKIAQIHQHGAALFDDTVGYILDIKDQPRGKEHQMYVSEFVSFQIKMFARQMIGAMEAGGGNIGREIERSLYLEPEPPSLWKKLFGG